MLHRVKKAKNDLYFHQEKPVDWTRSNKETQHDPFSKSVSFHICTVWRAALNYFQNSSSTVRPRVRILGLLFIIFMTSGKLFNHVEDEGNDTYLVGLSRKLNNL